MSETVALMTGATPGIGFATAACLIEERWPIPVVDPDGLPALRR